jgi:DNA-binding NarL/FixJ family response regulator
VLGLLGDGLSIPAIAMQMFISQSTAKTYVARLYEKLGAASYDGDHPYGNRVIGTFRPRVASDALGRTGAALCRLHPAHRTSAA